MSDLETRAADPTLAAYWRIVGVAERATGPYVAHAMDEDLELLCGARDWTLTMDARDAAYIAVPCGVCFPEVPEGGWASVHVQHDGRRIRCEHQGACECRLDPALSWQKGEQKK